MKLLDLVRFHKIKDSMVGVVFNRPAALFNRFNMPPNAITVVSLTLAFIGLSFLLINVYVYMVLFLAHTLIDGFDGYYARKYKRETKIGELLDHGGDFSTIVVVLILLSQVVTPFAYVLLGMYIFQMWLIITLGLSEKIFPSRSFMYFLFLPFIELILIAEFLFMVGSTIYTFILYFKSDSTEGSSSIEAGH